MNKLSVIVDAGFWENLNPELSITSTPFKGSSNSFEFVDADIDQCVQQIKVDGYLKIKPVISNNEVKIIADAVQRIVDFGLPPVFAFVYDQVWQYFGRLARVLDPVLGHDHKLMLAGMWAWHIHKDDSGFAPHRDLSTINNQADGRPANLTIWIPFTDATPLNSCMYVLPISSDKNYPDNLSASTIDDARDIRALPATAGEILAWDACILHWGSKASHWAKQPRISISMDFSSKDPAQHADHPLLYSKKSGLHIHESVEYPFQSRLNAIGEAIWTYKDRLVDLYPQDIDMLFEYCSKYSISPEQQSEVSSQAPYLIMSRDVAELINLQKYTEALPMIQEICRTHPGDIKAHHLLCKVYFSFNMLDDAINDVRNALAVFPDNQKMRELLFAVEKECETRRNN